MVKHKSKIKDNYVGMKVTKKEKEKINKEALEKKLTITEYLELCILCYRNKNSN